MNNIGMVSHVDFINTKSGRTREAFVHFKEFYECESAYKFQQKLEEEERVRMAYNENKFWTISKNFSKKPTSVFMTEDEEEQEEMESYNLDQSLSLYIPYVRDEVTLESFRCTFHLKWIGYVSHVDFISTPGRELREAFVHFKVFWDEEPAYKFQQKLKEEERIRLYYNEENFWTIFKNYSKKPATLGGRRIRLNLTEEAFNYEDPEEFVQEHATPEEMKWVSSDYVACLEKELEMLRCEKEFMEVEHLHQQGEIQKQEEEIKLLYWHLNQQQAVILQAASIQNEWWETSQERLFSTLLKNGIEEMKEMDRFQTEREEKLVEMVEDMKQDWSTKMEAYGLDSYSHEFQKQMVHLKMMMSKHQDSWAHLTWESELGYHHDTQAQDGNPQCEHPNVSRLKDLRTFKGLAQEYSQQYMVPQSYHALQQCPIYQIIQSGKVADDFPIQSFHA